MVTMSYDWPAGKWLFQGLMAGFVFLTLVFEYGKRYRRKRREREQQVILEKLLRGDVVLEWKNPKAIVPVNNKGCVLREMSSSHRGSFLINNYKQHGGFLGVGRGYYARRNKPEEESNSEAEHTDNRMLPFTKCNARSQDSSQPGESGNGNKPPEPAVRIITPGNSSFPENKDEVRMFQNVINSQPSLSVNNIRRKETGELAPKDATQSHMCKKMCEEMCYRIVKEHPFIAPFIRRDLLHEFQLDTVAEPIASNSATTSNATDVPTKWMEICNSLCQSPSAETTPSTVKFRPTIKKRARSMSRFPQSKMRNTPVHVEKRDSLIQKTSMSGVPKKSDLFSSKKAVDIKPECQRLNSTTNTAPRSKLVKSFRSRRSFSLCRKIPINDSDPFAQIRKLAVEAKVNPKEGTADEDKCTIQNEKGSSVDPMTAAPTIITEQSKTMPVCNEQINYGGDRKLAETPVKEDFEDIRKQSGDCLSGTDNKSSAEGRINEIVSALTSWGYSIKDKVRGKELGSTAIMQGNSVDGDTHPGFSVLSVTENVETTKLDSKALVDLIKNLASSRKNRKLLRQISSVLGTAKAPSRMSKNSKSFTKAQASPLAATTGARAAAKSPGNSQDSKDKKNSHLASDTGSKLPQDVKKTAVVKRRRIVRERSYFAKLSSMYKRESNHESSFNQTSVLPSNPSRKFSPPKLENELKERPRRISTPQTKHKKSPKNSNLKRLIIKKMGTPRMLKKENSKTQSLRLNSPLRQGIQVEGDHLEVDVDTECVKNYVKNGDQSPKESHLENQPNTEINNKNNVEVGYTKQAMNTNEKGRTTQVEETQTVSEGIKEYIEKDRNDKGIRLSNQVERESQTPDLWITKEVVSSIFSPSPVNKEVQAVETDVCAEATHEKPAKEEHTVSTSKEFKLSGVKETGKRVSATFNKHRNVDKQTEKRHTTFTRTQSKPVISNRARKISQISAGDIFSEIHTIKPAQRKTCTPLSKPAGLPKSNLLTKLPTSAYKSGNRKLQQKVEPAERNGAPVNPKHKEQQTRTFMKREKKINNESIKPILNKIRENSHTASKARRQKSNETRSRFEQYQENKLTKNVPFPTRRSPVNKQAPVEVNQNINQASRKYIDHNLEADQNQAFDTVDQLHATHTRPLLPPASVTYTNCSMYSETPEIMMNSVEAENRHTDYHHMLDACISFENDQFESHSDGDDVAAWEIKTAGNNYQQPFNILKKSKLDIVVSSMLNAKSIFRAPDS